MVDRADVSYLYEAPNQRQLPDNEGYLASHEDFSMIETPIPHPLNKDYSIKLTLSARHKWLYLDLIYFDIADATTCPSGLVMREIGNENFFYHVCSDIASLPERIIPLNSEGVTIELAYKFQKEMDNERRGVLLYYKSYYVMLVFAVSSGVYGVVASNSLDR